VKNKRLEMKLEGAIERHAEAQAVLERAYFRTMVRAGPAPHFTVGGGRCPGMRG
jgi:hypothetical protein